MANEALGQPVAALRSYRFLANMDDVTALGVASQTGTDTTSLRPCISGTAAKAKRDGGLDAAASRRGGRADRRP
jgi:hypothetical protein